jgi:flagellar biosynthesis protein FlhA
VIINDFFTALTAIGVVILVLMMFIPLPIILLDILMVMNLIICLLILLIVARSNKATNFSILPTVLLVVSVFSLCLNVSSTRLILIEGADFNSRIIRVLSILIVGSGDIKSLIVSSAIFIVIVVVQAMVIIKGATRIAEVAARFAQDTLPGKQMTIEAEYNSQAITEEEAIARKEALQHEVDFYGVLDGSSKFIAGNFKAGILITALTILGGILIGVKIHGGAIIETVEIYVSFAIGVSLFITQLPILLMSTTIGISITRSV